MAVAAPAGRASGSWAREAEWSRNRRECIRLLADGVRDVLGPLWGTEWEWQLDGVGEGAVGGSSAEEVPWPTPAASPEPAGTAVDCHRGRATNWDARGLTDMDERS